jgi:rod shape determining protein RodA
MIARKKSIINLKFIFSWWENIDWFLLILVLGLTIFGGLMIYSTQIYEQGTDWLQQLIMTAIGFIILMLIAKSRYELLLEIHWIIYGVVNFLLIVAIILGTTVNGAQSWIYLGGFNFQPSEFAKLGIIITLAAILHNRDASNIISIVRTLAITAVPWILILLQPDLGTSLVFGAITLGMLYWANADLGWIVLMLSPLVSAFLFNLALPFWIIFVLLMVAIAWFTLPWRAMWALIVLAVNFATGTLGHILWDVLKPYQKDRLTLFLEPEKDPLGGGYHLIQSRIAIGSGEKWGHGIFKGTQTQLNFVPEQHTDFIYSAIGDQFGFVGCMIVLVVFWLICLRLVVIACTAKENFGSLLAIGVLSMIAFQTIINISMTVGIAPITGIPLPWLSYGRSSLLTNFIAIGLVESVANYRNPRLNTTKRDRKSRIKKSKFTFY